MNLLIYIGDSDVPYTVPVIAPGTLEQARLDMAAICREGFWIHGGRMFFPPHRIRYIVTDDESTP